jgi:hypothetical protein
MQLSKHAKKRMMQRGRIPEAAVEMIVKYGNAKYNPGGVKEYKLSKRAVDDLTKGIKKTLQLLPKLKNVAVVVGDDDEIVTVYRRN